MNGSTHPRTLLRGAAVSPGIAMGPAYLFHPEQREVVKRLIPPEKVEAEIARLRRALDRAQKEIQALQIRIREEVGDYEARIFESHILLLRDEEILAGVLRDIRENLYNAEYAYHRQMELLTDRFGVAAGGFLKEHRNDLRDVATRVVDVLMLAENVHTTPDLETPVIVLSRNLMPSELSQFKRRNTLGLIIEVGGHTSHVAILARSLEIPAVSGIHWNELRIESGQNVIVDGNAGTVILNPSLRDIKEYELKHTADLAEEQELSSLRDLDPVTQDGKYIELAANIELPVEIENVLEYGADGVGLYRSEFLFLTREDIPSEEEQFTAYRYLAERMAPRPVTIRTLDAGGDKLVPALRVSGERNPYMGWRSIRMCLRNPDIFKTQLRAVLRASILGNVRLMFPMISNLRELREASALVELVRSELRAQGVGFDPAMPIGCMIEVPSAVLIAGDLAREVDFFSIGTNDLVQFTLAVDRANERVADLFEPQSPAVFRQIQSVVNIGRAHGIPVGICGEMASNPYSAIVFIGMGIDELSMNPGALLEIKRLIRNLSFEEARECSQEVMRLTTADEINRWLRRRYHDKLSRVGVRRVDA